MKNVVKYRLYLMKNYLNIYCDALLTYKASFLGDPSNTSDEKYAYDIIKKAYWINEKKIEMLD